MTELHRSENYIYSLEDTLSPYDKKSLFKLWNAAYPMQLQYQSIELFDKYLNNLSAKQSILVRTFGNQLIGYLLKFEREGERWFTIIINDQFQKEGIGKKLIALGKQQFGSLNGWVIDHDRYFLTNGEKYLSPLSFYIKNGCRVNYANRLETALISAVKISL